MVIFTFIFQSELFLYSTTGDELNHQFLKAKNEYINGQYIGSKIRLERLIGIINEDGLARKDILGKCYLLLGAIYEKEGNVRLAEENYSKAKEEYGIQSVEGVALKALDIYGKIVKAEKPSIKKIIEKPATSASKIKRKKKFPVLLVVAGVAVVAGLLLLLTKKKKEPPPLPNPEFITSTDSLNVPEGGTAAFEVRLSAQPSSDVSVSVTRVSGDTDITVQSGSSLTFTTTNWNQNQTITLAASEDQDTSSDSATIRLSASGISNIDITAAEQDNDVMSFLTDTASITVREGQSASFGVKLSHPPSPDIQATVTPLSGDTDIYVILGGNLYFTTSNWNTYQTVTLRAAEDSDTIDGQATFRISANDVQYKDITAIEDDNDSEGCNVSISITSHSNNAPVSGTITIQTSVSTDCVMDRVEFYIDNILKNTDTSSPYTFTWNTSSVSDGKHSIKVKAYAKTNQTDEDEITVKVNNLDDPPTVSITSPLNNAIVNGITLIQANASDDIGISKVEFYIDGFLKATDTSSPYSYNWDTDTTEYPNAVHFLKAIAYDTKNQSAQHEITVTVNN
jgi:hypothetical protein